MQQATLRQETVTLIKTLEIAEAICALAEKHEVPFPCMTESVFGESPFRFDFPRRGNVDRVHGRVMIYRHEVPGQWSIQFILRCGRVGNFHSEVYLQSDLRYQHPSRYTIRINDTYGLVHTWLGITEKPNVKQSFRGTTQDAVLLPSKKRFNELMRAMMKFYIEQPEKLANWPEDPLKRAV